jgi:hypothetical protein
MVLQSFFWKKRKIGAEAATDPSSSRGRGKVELNSLCSFFFWMEEDGAVSQLSFWRMRNMELKSYESYFLDKEKTMELSHILLEEEEDWRRSCN